MYPKGLVFGLLASSADLTDTKLAAKLRSYTISWSRYGYRGPILEDTTIDAILIRALQRGYRWCLIQRVGHIIDEHWYPSHWNRVTFEAGLAGWLETTDFFVTGNISRNGSKGFGLDDRCLLVDLSLYDAFGRPAYDCVVNDPVECVEPLVRRLERDGCSRLAALMPGRERRMRIPSARGWKFIDVSLRDGKPVYQFPPELDEHRVVLSPTAGDGGCRMEAPTNGERQQRFLAAIDVQAQNARRGVFLWNIESYKDMQTPPQFFQGPISSLYSVAAGFKPNAILHSHCFDDQSRVVFFDYSANALEVKRLLQEEWDGHDYPRFVQYLFRKMPYPETYYQLWGGQTPETVAGADLDRFWQAELSRWGGERAFAEHWQRYRSLRHEYMHCNVLTEPTQLFETIDDRPGAVIWWSNAFFTMYGNWLYTLEERRRLYTAWIEGLASQNPEMVLYGSDYNNQSVNQLRARDYLRYYSETNWDDLTPLQVGKYEIRF
jgi:hypothetical protein